MARRRVLTRSLAAGASIVFLKFTAALPIGIARRLGRGLGRAAYTLVPRVRNVALQNLDLAYGETLPRAEKRRIAKEAAINLGIVAAEFSRIPEVRRGEPRHAVEVKGLEHIGDGGALVVSAHFANWEWMCLAVAALGRPIGVVVRPFDNPRLNAVIDDLRHQGGLVTISKDAAAGEVIRRVREGALIGLLIDQSPRENGVPVTFFGRQTWATAGAAMIALRGRLPLHAIVMRRHANGSYTAEFTPRIEVERTGDLSQDLITVTQRCQDVIERAIRENPTQWLWMHRRFKPRPRLEAEWKARLERRTKHHTTPIARP